MSQDSSGFQGMVTQCKGLKPSMAFKLIQQGWLSHLTWEKFFALNDMSSLLRGPLDQSVAAATRPLLAAP